MSITVGIIGASTVAGCGGDGGEEEQAKAGSISITAGFDASQGAQCAPNTSGVVTFRISPANLSGELGISTDQSDTRQLPEFAQEVSRDIEGGFPLYGCQASKTFLNLKPGVWFVQVSGAAGTGSCHALVQAARETRAKIQQSVCSVEDNAVLTVVTVNMANADDVRGVDWKTRVDRLAAQITGSGLIPDVISLTESAGLWRCSGQLATRGADDYDMVDRLIWRLRLSTGVRFRVAYMVGMNGSVNNSAGTPLCWYFSGDTLLYNPSRIRNLTPADVVGRAQAGHIDTLEGFQVRRSLPLCRRGSNLEPLETLIDGPEQVDRCNVPTPSGPAWVQMDRTRKGDWALVASLARLALAGVPGSSFDVVTTHPPNGEEDDHAAPIEEFVAALTTAPLRTSTPYYPVIVLGDFNALAERQWPRHTTMVFRPPADVMAVAIGSGIGMEPAHGLSKAFAMTLPVAQPCRDSTDGPAVDLLFSDHCGLVVRFSEN